MSGQAYGRATPNLRLAPTSTIQIDAQNHPDCRRAEAVLRRPAVTARMLADQLDIAPQSALVLLKQLVAAYVLREATGRAAWRAYTVA